MRSLTASSFAKHPGALAEGEAPGFSPTLAFQDSKNSPLHANRGATSRSVAEHTLGCMSPLEDPAFIAGQRVVRRHEVKPGYQEEFF
jgi:hypothetical protein